MATDELTAEQVEELLQRNEDDDVTLLKRFAKSHERLRADRDRWLVESSRAFTRGVEDGKRELREEIAAKDAEIQRLKAEVKALESALVSYDCALADATAPADEGKTCAPMEDWRGANEDWRKR